MRPLARDTLDPEAYAAAREEATSLGFHDAVAYALTPVTSVL